MTAAAPRHAPARTCIGCRRRRPKSDLVRLVRKSDGLVVVDESGGDPGRGAYVCADAACLERALKTGRLGHAFRKPSHPGARLAEAIGSRAMKQDLRR